MMSHDDCIDNYIDASVDFARPILRHLRVHLHAAAPQIVETIKWNMPFFVIGGRPFANMAAFKAHASFGFWKRDERTGHEGEAMDHFGRLTCIADLPDDATFDRMIAEAAAALASGAPRSRPYATPKAPLPTPDELAVALDAQPIAKAVFDGLPPGSRRDYVDWITGAKRPETRARRVATAVAQLAEGKKLNWKYENC